MRGEERTECGGMREKNRGEREARWEQGEWKE